MAQYDIDYQCGHGEVKQLYGPESGRVRTIAKLEKQLCPDCYKAKQTELAQQYAKAQDLPELQGTDKQVQWAQTIRAEKLKAVGTPGVTAAEEVLDQLKARTSAKWWIDNRDEHLDRLLRPAIDAAARQAASKSRRAIVSAVYIAEKKLNGEINRIEQTVDTVARTLAAFHSDVERRIGSARKSGSEPTNLLAQLKDIEQAHDLLKTIKVEVSLEDAVKQAVKDE